MNPPILKSSNTQGIVWGWRWGILYRIWTNDLPFGLLAQLVVHCTSVAEVMSQNPIQTWIFFRPYLHYCLSNVHYCDDCFYIHFFVCSSHMIFHMFTVNSNTSMEWYICLSHKVVTSDVGCEVFIAYCWSSSCDGVSWVHVTFILLCSAVIGWNSRAVIGTSFRSVFLCGLHPTNNLT